MCKIVDYTNCSWICIDIANGYMQRLVDFCRKVREKYPDKIIVAGNVATREMVEELIINGKVDRPDIIFAIPLNKLTLDF